jgi:hypothetical protein
MVKKIIAVLCLTFFIATSNVFAGYEQKFLKISSRVDGESKQIEFKNETNIDIVHYEYDNDGTMLFLCLKHKYNELNLSDIFFRQISIFGRNKQYENLSVFKTTESFSVYDKESKMTTHYEEMINKEIDCVVRLNIPYSFDTFEYNINNLLLIEMIWVDDETSEQSTTESNKVYQKLDDGTGILIKDTNEEVLIFEDIEESDFKYSFKPHWKGYIENIEENTITFYAVQERERIRKRGTQRKKTILNWIKEASGNRMDDVYAKYDLKDGKIIDTNAYGISDSLDYEKIKRNNRNKDKHNKKK